MISWTFNEHAWIERRQDVEEDPVDVAVVLHG
jgi:hypothetical protein